MAAYTIEQQREDLAVVQHTKDLLGARTIGERQNECEDMLQDYIRIARYWAHPKLGDARTQLECYRMFLDLAENQKISPFMLEPYERLLKQTKKLIQMKIFRRKRKPEETCEQPDVHIQKCFCARMHAAQLVERIVP